MPRPVLQPLDIETGFVAGHADVQASLPGAGDARLSALKAFETDGLPHRRGEAYRYFDLRQMLAKSGPLKLAAADSGDLAFSDPAASLFKDVDRHVAVFINGHFSAAQSSLDALPKGLEVMSYALAVSTGVGWLDTAAAVEREDDAVSALNSAYAADGAAVHVAAGTKVEKPLELVWYSTGDAAAHYHTQSAVVLDEGAELTVLQSRGDSVTSPLFATNAVSISVGANAKLHHAVLYADALDAVRISQNAVRLEANARYEMLSLAVGAGRARTSEHVHFAGENAHADVNGLSLLHGKAVMDNTLFVDHAVPNCSSEETYRYVLDDQSRGVFQGSILVREHAQKIDAQMQARALLMSRKAEMDSKPMLEIYADDVICAHGSAIGEPDQSAIFYLMSRGIDEKTARALLVAGFLDDVVDGFDAGEIGAAFKLLLAQRLGAPEDTAREVNA